MKDYKDYTGIVISRFDHNHNVFQETDVVNKELIKGIHKALNRFKAEGQKVPIIKRGPSTEEINVIAFSKGKRVDAASFRLYEAADLYSNGEKYHYEDPTLWKLLEREVVLLPKQDLRRWLNESTQRAIFAVERDKIAKFVKQNSHKIRLTECRAKDSVFFEKEAKLTKDQALVLATLIQDSYADESYLPSADVVVAFTIEGDEEFLLHVNGNAMWNGEWLVLEVDESITSLVENILRDVPAKQYTVRQMLGLRGE